jgi:hypothetical protein
MDTSQNTEQPVVNHTDIPSITQSELTMGGIQVTGMFCLVMILREIRMLVKECKS